MTDSNFIFQKYADFTGRAGRTEFMLIALAALAIIALGPWIDARNGTIDLINARMGPWQVMTLLIGLLPLLSVTVRRLHDTDRSGFWLFLAYFPYLATHIFAAVPNALHTARGALGLALALILWFLLQQGTGKDNRFGAITLTH